MEQENTEDDKDSVTSQENLKYEELNSYIDVILGPHREIFLSLASNALSGGSESKNIK